MSYAEHGPRIFLAEGCVSRKRSEGRLKMYESCSDLRAWGPSVVESSRHVRELTENVAVERMIPANVLIENIIGFTSKAQNELRLAKVELERYKSLKLTPDQEEQIRGSRNAEPNERPDQDVPGQEGRPVVLRGNNSFVCLRADEALPSAGFRLVAMRKLFPYPPLSLDLSGILRPEAYPREKSKQCLEYVDTGLQACPETRQAEAQTDPEDQELAAGHDDTSGSGEFAEETEMERTTENVVNVETENSVENLEFETEWESSSGTGTELRLRIGDDDQKEIIIEKDSEIIVLKNEICVKEAELEELRDANNRLEDALKDRETDLIAVQENLMSSREKLSRIDREHVLEVEDLRKRLSGCNYLIEQLKEELNERSRTCYLQSQEIETLQLYANEVATLRTEKDSLTRRLKEMDQLRTGLRERDELKRQYQEQSCVLADQEDEINRLLLLIKQMSVAYNQKAKLEETMNSLRSEVREKESRIRAYEDRMTAMRREVDDFFLELRRNLSEFETSDEIVHQEPTIADEANSLLAGLRAMLGRFKDYELQREELLQEVQALKQLNIGQGRVKENVVRDEEVLRYRFTEKQVDSTSRQDSVILVTVTESRSMLSREINSEIDDDDDDDEEEAFNSAAESEASCYPSSSTDEFDLKTERPRRTVKLDTMCNVEEIEREIVEHVSHSLEKMQTLTRRLEVYVDVERPSLIRQMQTVQERLRDAQLAITSDQDAPSRKKRIYELYARSKQTADNRDQRSSMDPDCDLCAMQARVKESIEAILYQNLQDIDQLETMDTEERRIDRALELYLSSCIRRVNATIRDAGDQSTQIAAEMSKQRQQLEEKETVIAELREKIARYGQGDYVTPDELERQKSLKGQLSKVTGQLTEMGQLVTSLEKRLNRTEDQLRLCVEERNAIGEREKNLEIVGNRLKEELNARNRKIECLERRVEEMSGYGKDANLMEERIREMENSLSTLRSENDDLRQKLSNTKTILTDRDRLIDDLKDRLDRSERTTNRKLSESKQTESEIRAEIIDLRSENDRLSSKLRQREDQLLNTNRSIAILTEENDRVRLIQDLQRDIARLDTGEKRLKGELNELKARLSRDREANGELEQRLNECSEENERLRVGVDYWKCENDRLVREVREADRIQDDRWGSITERLCEMISRIRRGSRRVDRDLRFDRGQQTSCETREASVGQDEQEETKDKEKRSARNIQDDLEDARQQVKCLEEENDRLKNETIRLLQEVNQRDSEIGNLMESIKSLNFEKNELQAVIKSQADEYQEKLTVIKRNYDRSLNALCERHKESIETLQLRFEDIILSEGRTFDPEKWLQSLSLKELMDVHERVCRSAWCTSFKVRPANENTTTSKKESQSRDDREFDEELVPVLDNKQNVELAEEKSRQDTVRRCPSTRSQGKTTRKHRTSSRDNSRLELRLEEDRKCPEDTRTTPGKSKQPTRNDGFDKQRWNFINQCSFYHNFGNAC